MGKVRSKSFIKTFKENIELLSLSLPGLLFLFVFSYLPMFGIIIAFKNYIPSKGIFGSKWVLFDNFKFLFTSRDLLKIVKNSLSLNFLFIVTGTVISIAFALMLFELSRKSVKVFQTVLFFPFFISWVIAGYSAYALLNYDFGGLNNLLKDIGLQSVVWYFEPKYWVFILAIAFIWKSAGYYCLIYYTGLLGIDSSYYEVASIDGARKMQQIWYISLPLLKPLIIMLTLLNVGKIFYSDFGLFYFISRDSSILYPVTDVIDTYVYRALKNTGELGMGAATGLFQSLVGFLMVLVSNMLIRKYSRENALF